MCSRELLTAKMTRVVDTPALNDPQQGASGERESETQCDVPLPSAILQSRLREIQGVQQKIDSLSSEQRLALTQVNSFLQTFCSVRRAEFAVIHMGGYAGSTRKRA